jgi:hypothetical protein
MTLWRIRKEGVWVPVDTGQPPATEINSLPSAPGDLSATMGTTTAVLTWLASIDVDGFVMSYHVSVNGVLVATVGDLSYTVTGLSDATDYTFAVAAVDNSGGISPQSTVLSTTLQIVIPVTDVTHGSEISTGNTGVLAYFDAALGRTLLLSDLTVHTAKVTISSLVSTGGTLTKHDFQGGVIIDRAVTFVACKFYGATTIGVTSTVTFNWCTGTSKIGGVAGDYTLGYGHFAAYRCQLGGNSDGIKAGGNCTVVECYIRTQGQDALDHNDGMQDSGGHGPVTIQRCNIDARPQNALGGANGALFTADAATGLMTWEDNWLAGGAYTIRCYENATYVVQGNQVLSGSFSASPAHRAVIPSTDVVWGTVRPNVVVDTSGTVLSTIPAP